jgi:KDO2-lipid IV(A) lauroyltransferase
LLYGFLRLVALLPFKLQLAIGRGLGRLSYWLARDRRDACEVNLKLCFPELSDEERQRLVYRTFLSNGIGLMEIAMAWFGDLDRFKDRVQIDGLEVLEQARAKGKGVLLLGAHFTTLEMGGLLFRNIAPLDVTYRPNDNAFFDAIMYNGRKRNLDGVYDRKEIRQVIKSLKSGRMLWYAPDQDYGPKNSVFAPFFGVPAATVTATSRYAKVNNSEIVFYGHYRKADDSGYHVIFTPLEEDYPTGDDVEDASIINRAIEKAIRHQPDQYLWLHKRFKTQQAGPAARPYNDRKAREAREQL